MSVLQSISGEQREALLAHLLLELGEGGTMKPRKKRAKARTETIKYLTEEETAKFFKSIDSTRDRAIFMVMYKRGLRASEIGMLQLSDWQIARDRIVFNRLKGSNGGEYHLTAAEVKALKSWLKERGSEPGPLFPSRKGSAISRKMLDVLMKAYGAKAGIPKEKMHCHAFKHACGTHLLERGESLEDVQDHLGHVNIQSTLVYAKFRNSRRQARDRRLRDW